MSIVSQSRPIFTSHVLPQSAMSVKCLILLWKRSYNFEFSLTYVGSESSTNFIEILRVRLKITLLSVGGTQNYSYMN
jgi:hypothetical protein